MSHGCRGDSQQEGVRQYEDQQDLDTCRRHQIGVGERLEGAQVPTAGDHCTANSNGISLMA